MLKQITTGVYMYEDSCNVYLLKSGNKGLLIDIGTGSVLNHLKQAGVAMIEKVFITHAHRDQCQGISELVSHGAYIAAPKGEQSYIGEQEVKKFWNEHYPLVDSKTYYSTLSKGYDDVHCQIAAGETIEWEEYHLEALDASGHTPGQLAYLLHHADGNILFCGDAWHVDGKIWRGNSLDWDHFNPDGVIAACKSLERMEACVVEVLAPAHGTLARGDVKSRLALSLESMRKYADFKSFESYHLRAGGRSTSRRVPVLSTFTFGDYTANQLSEHLWIQDNSYFLISAEKRCLMIDCGYEYMREFVPKFLESVGCTGVDVVIPTHAHNDHVEFLNILKELYGTQIWALDLICSVIETPERYWHPYSRWAGIVIDRQIQDKAKVRWKEYELQFHWYPGQTTFASAIESVVDGRHVLFSGDNFFPVEQWTGTGGIMGLNRGLPEGHAFSAEKTRQISPEWVLAAHGFPILYDAIEFQNRENWAWDALIFMKQHAPVESEWRLHFDPHYLSAYPFINRANRGEFVNVWLVGEKSDFATLQMDSLVWELPEGYSVSAAPDGSFDPQLAKNIHQLRFSSEPQIIMPFEIQIPSNAETGCQAIYVQHRQKLILEAVFIIKVI